MLILADKRIPKQALVHLKKHGEALEFETSTITYQAISGHPDIFFCQTENELVVAPNLPENMKQKLVQSAISFREGKGRVGSKYPQTAAYNCVVTEKFLIHNTALTDGEIINKLGGHEKIDVKQGYTRCNLLALKNDRFITSDKGIKSALKHRGLEVLFVNPKGILLPGFTHGFFGGTCGILQDKVFFIGNLSHFPEGEKVRQFLSSYEIIELYDGPLVDGGSLIFIS
jgi:hypothetical protein